MNVSALSKKTVKVISQKIEIDWLHPYKNTQTKQSIGSGFFIDNKGHIITCSHVIQNSKKVFIEIPFEGDEKIEVDVIGLCPELDIALLKTKNYQNTEFYDLHSRKEIYSIRPGSEVFAVGFPLGQDNLKFTKGIISGRQNSLIQTDTPINPGNSGGPLLLDGKVIGINTSIILFTNNIGYATPISFYYIIQKELFQKGTNKLIKQPQLGLSYQNSNQALIDINRCKCEGGILVKEVFKGSPCAKAGIKKGDIICAVNGIKVDNYGLFDFPWFNEKMRLGDILKTIIKGETIQIDIWRKNKLLSKKAVFNYYNLEIEEKFPLYESEKIDYEIFGGMIIMEITDNHLELIMEDIENEFGRRKSISKRLNNILQYINPENKRETRLIITHIFPNSYLKNFDILSDYDIIEKVNNKKCTNLLDFRKYIKLTKNNSKHKYIELTTEINNTVALDIQELLKEEKLFAETYKYNLSNLYKHFNKTPKLNSNSLKRKTKLTKTKLTKTKLTKKLN